MRLRVVVLRFEISVGVYTSTNYSRSQALRRVDSVPDSHSEFSELTGLSRILEFSRLID